MKHKEFNTLEKKNILITGITGFIGANLARHLLKRGANVSGTLRSSSQLDKLSEVQNQLSFHTLDLSKMNEVSTLIKDLKPDIIIHAAQPSAYDLHEPSALLHQLKTTSQIAINLLESIKTNKATKIIHCCGSAVYGKKNKSPFSEKEEPIPDSARGLVKLQERNLFKYYAEKHDLEVVIARIFRAYGPRDSSKKLIIKIIDSAKNDLMMPISPAPFMRDFIYIDDLAEAFAQICSSKLPNGMELNIGSGHQHSASQILEELETIMQEKVKVSADPFQANFLDKLDYRADISQTQNVLNWKPSTSLVEGLEKTVTWYEAHCSQHA